MYRPRLSTQLQPAERNERTAETPEKITHVRTGLRQEGYWIAGSILLESRGEAGRCRPYVATCQPHTSSVLFRTCGTSFATLNPRGSPALLPRVERAAVLAVFRFQPFGG